MVCRCAAARGCIVCAYAQCVAETYVLERAPTVDMARQSGREKRRPVSARALDLPTDSPRAASAPLDVARAERALSRHQPAPNLARCTGHDAPVITKEAPPRPLDRYYDVTASEQSAGRDRGHVLEMQRMLTREQRDRAIVARPLDVVCLLSVVVRRIGCG